MGAFDVGAAGLARDDVRAVLDVVERLTRRALEPAAARPDRPMDAAALEAVVAEAGEAGLLPAAAGDPGVWAGNDALAQGLTVAALRRLARAAAGPAFEVHQRALALRLARRAGLPDGGRLVPLLFGRAGPGRDALLGLFPESAAADAEAGEDREILLDVLPGPRHGPDRSFLLQAGRGFEAVVAPVLEDDGRTLGWARLEAADLHVEVSEGAHGLDETALHRVGFPARLAGARRAELDPDAARGLLLDAAAASALGITAVALGAAEHALDLARAQAVTRRQGGRALAGHAAVRRLVGEASAAVAVVAAALAGLEGPARTLEDLLTVLRVRAVAHPLLTGAANAALQVFGGTGYMRDTGLEKIVRDENHLRALEGAPGDLLLLAGRWEVAR